MSLNRGQLNPLSVLGCRKLNFIPSHFKTLTIAKNVDINLLDYWINFNLNSRYALIKKLALDDNNKTIEIIEGLLKEQSFDKNGRAYFLGDFYYHSSW